MYSTACERYATRCVGILGETQREFMLRTNAHDYGPLKLYQKPTFSVYMRMLLDAGRATKDRMLSNEMLSVR